MAFLFFKVTVHSRFEIEGTAKACFQAVTKILNCSCEAVTSATASGPLTSEAKLKGECEARVRELEEVSCE
jgi:hypothetical protein